VSHQTNHGRLFTVSNDAYECFPPAVHAVLQLPARDGQSKLFFVCVNFTVFKWKWSLGKRCMYNLKA